jgi:hypothetical protein
MRALVGVLAVSTIVGCGKKQQEPPKGGPEPVHVKAKVAGLYELANGGKTTTPIAATSYVVIGKGLGKGPTGGPMSDGAGFPGKPQELVLDEPSDDKDEDDNPGAVGEKQDYGAKMGRKDSRIRSGQYSMKKAGAGGFTSAAVAADAALLIVDKDLPAEELLEALRQTRHAQIAVAVGGDAAGLPFAWTGPEDQTFTTDPHDARPVVIVGAGAVHVLQSDGHMRPGLDSLVAAKDIGFSVDGEPTVADVVATLVKLEDRGVTRMEIFATPRGGWSGKPDVAKPLIALGAVEAVDVDTNALVDMLHTADARFTDCYERAFSGKPRPTGTATVTITITIDPKGAVTKASAQGPDDSLDACLVSVLDTIALPKPRSKKATDARVQFVLHDVAEDVP